MKKIPGCVTLLFILFMIPLASNAEVTDIRHMASFGIAGSFGAGNIWTRKGMDQWERGILYGGGIIMETMISDRWGVFSALLVDRNIHTLTLQNPVTSTPMKADWVFWRLDLPVCWVTSFNIDIFSLQLLTGINIAHVLSSELRPSAGYVNPVDVHKFLNYYSAGLAGGFNLVFRVSDYTDLMLGILGQMEFTNLNSKDRSDSKNEDYYYNARIISGVLFRTDIFPPE